MAAEKEEDKEQGPILDLVDKITDKESNINFDVQDVGGKIMGQSFRLMGKINVNLGTLKKPK